MPVIKFWSFFALYLSKKAFIKYKKESEFEIVVLSVNGGSRDFAGIFYRIKIKNGPSIDAMVSITPLEISINKLTFYFGRC